MPECKKLMRNKHPEEFYKGTKAKTVICESCGKEFQTNHQGKLTCSKECRKKRDRIREFRNKEISDFVIFERDGFRCVYCGKSSVEDGVRLEIEHIYPIKKEGSADLFNIVTACSVCNGQKSAMIISDDNILRIWQEVQKRNEKGGIDHFEYLKQKLHSVYKNRKDRLAENKDYKNG